MSEAPRDEPQDGRPIRVVDLSLELDVPPSELRRRARVLVEGRAHLMGTVYLDWTTGLLTAYAADRLRGFTPLSELARELGVLPSDVGRAAHDLERDLNVGGGNRSVYGANGLLAPFAAARLRELRVDVPVRLDPEPVPDITAEDLDVLRLPDRGYGKCPSTDPHGAHVAVNGQECRTRYTCIGVDVPVHQEPVPRNTCGVCGGGTWYQDCPTGGWWVHDSHPADGHDATPLFWTSTVRMGPEPTMEQVASLLLRQDMALVDADSRALTDSISGDRTILAWALSTAGHLFDRHTLWDYDLLSDAEHVHRCFDHRHYGPGTRLGDSPRG